MKYEEEKEAERVLRSIRENRLYNAEVPMQVTIEFLKCIRELLNEDIAALTEESE